MASAGRLAAGAAATPSAGGWLGQALALFASLVCVCAAPVTPSPSKDTGATKRDNAFARCMIFHFPDVAICIPQAMKCSDSLDEEILENVLQLFVEKNPWKNHHYL